MKKLVLSLAMMGMTAVPVVLAAPSIAQTATSFVVIDTDRAIGESTAYKAAQATLKPQADALQSRATTLSTQLKTEAETLSKAREANTMAQPAFEAKVKEFQTKQNSARTELEGKQRTLQLSQAYVLEQINKALEPIIRAVMVDKKANAALPAAATVAVGPGVDVTQDVITRLNSSLPSVTTTPPAGWQPRQ